MELNLPQFTYFTFTMVNLYSLVYEKPTKEQGKNSIQDSNILTFDL